MKKNKIFLFFSLVFILSFIFYTATNSNLDKTIEEINNYDSKPFVDVYGKQRIEQKFVSRVDNLDNISLQIGTYGKTFMDEVIQLNVYDSQLDLIVSKNINVSSLNDCQYINIDFDEQNSKLEKYTLEVMCEKCTKEKPIALFGVESHEVDALSKFNEVPINYSMTLLLSGTNYNYAYIKILFVLFIINIVLILKNISVKKIDEILSKKYMFNILHFVISIIGIISLYKIIYIYSYMSHYSINYLMLLLVSLTIIIYLLIYSLKNYHKLENIFLTLMIPIGLAYLIFMIPNQVADENVHYVSAYNIATGNIMNLNLYAEYPHQMLENSPSVVTNYEKLTEVLKLSPDFKNVATSNTNSRYISILYLPASTGLFIGKTLNLSCYLGYYLARVLSFVVFLFIGYCCIKIIPFGKMVMFVYLFNPMLIHQIISISADSLIISFCLLFVCYILKLLYDDDKLTKKRLLILSFLTICVALGKYVYIPLILLLFLLFKNESPKNKKILFSLFGISVILCIGLYIYINFVDVGPGSSYTIQNNVDSLAQLKNVIKHPTIFFEMYYRTFMQLGSYYLETFLGSSLGWLNVHINELIIYSYLILLCFSPFLSINEKYPNIKLKISFLLITIITAMLIIFGLYLSWTPVGDLVALGIQGRYFLPIAFMLLLIPIQKDRYIKINNSNLVISLILIMINVCTITTIIYNFI